MAGGDNKASYILSLDVGSSSLRAHVYDDRGQVLGSSSQEVITISPSPTYYEIEPEPFFNSVLDCLRRVIKDCGLRADQITCLGITVQRNTFITWDSKTGKPYHNFISWLDLRSRNIVKRWNRSLSLKFLHGGAKVLYLFTRNDRYKIIGSLKFSTLHVSMRLLWVLDHIAELHDRIKEGRVMFGCIETWLTWKLTNGAVFATDYSCASATGIYDPFELKWNGSLLNMLGIPPKLQLPEVRDTSGKFGTCSANLLGAPIPITCLVADQQGAMFGQCCFNTGDIKCTMGTGSFINVNTGLHFHASNNGLLSMIAWKIGDDLTYMAEGVVSDTGKAINWAKKVGYLSDISSSAAVAQSVPDSGGVSFISSLGGTKMPLNDDPASAPYVGATNQTTDAHIIRAILESCAFRIKLLYNVFSSEMSICESPIKTDGGMSQNDFLMQLLCDFTHHKMDKSHSSDMTSLGAAFLAGLSMGVWKDKDELCTLRRADTKTYEPGDPQRWQNYQPCYRLWTRNFRKAQHCSLSGR